MTQMSSVEEVYSLILEYDEDEFIVGDLRERAPWLRSSIVSSACFRLERTGVLRRGDRMLEASGRPWIWHKVPDAAPPGFSRARPGHKRGFKGHASESLTNVPEDLNQAERIVRLYDRLLETISEIEGMVDDLRLENLPNADITREYHKRKEAASAPKKEPRS